jgi:hypothetical protein
MTDDYSCIDFPDPEPPPPCVAYEDISSFVLKVSYDPSVCSGGHRCNRARFDVYINSNEVGEIDLNNASDGGYRESRIILPAGTASQDAKYKIELVGIPSPGSVHRGIAKIQIIDPSTDEVIFEQCAPDDKALLIPICS